MEEKEKKKKREKKTKKKIKMKKKVILIPMILLVIGVLGVGGYYGYDYFQKDTVKSIKRVYSEKVITKKNTKLYDKNKKEVGTIQKGFELSLEEVKNITMKNRYLKIKDSTYYIYYKDIKKNKTKEKEQEASIYLSLEKSIETKKEVILYDGKAEAITLKNGLKDILVEKMDKENYYVSLFNKTLKIKKSKDIKETEVAIDYVVKKADHVSTIYYDKIKNDCGGDSTCLIPASVKAHLKSLTDKEYYFITKEDYISYLNGYVNLKEKAVFIATGEETEEVKKLNEEIKANISKIEEKDGIKLTVTNKTSTPQDNKEAVNCYQAKNYTIIDNYLRMANGEEVPDNGKETSNNQGIAVMNYHFFFDSSKGEDCNQTICLEAYKLREHLQWLKDNGYKTLTIHEFADWMDGIIEIPDKSVLLTIDDGWMGTGIDNGNILIPLLEEYQLHATLFLITGWWDINNYQSPYLDVQSHSYDLHVEAQCADGRGTLVCSDYNTVKDNLQKSLDVLRDNTSFCFPFYSYDRESLQAISDLGFRVAFVGGSTKARRSNNHHLIPRYPVLSDITLNDFIYCVS